MRRRRRTQGGLHFHKVTEDNLESPVRSEYEEDWRTVMKPTQRKLSVHPRQPCCVSSELFVGGQIMLFYQSDVTLEIVAQCDFMLMPFGWGNANTVVMPLLPAGFQGVIADIDDDKNIRSAWPRSSSRRAAASSRRWYQWCLACQCFKYGIVSCLEERFDHIHLHSVGWFLHKHLSVTETDCIKKKLQQTFKL